MIELQSKPKLNDEALGLIAGKFRALSEPMRLKLLNCLMQGERTVGELVGETGGGQANVSKHLSILRDAGMVGMRKKGTSTLCAISDPDVFQLCELMCVRLRKDFESKSKALEYSDLGEGAGR